MTWHARTFPSLPNRGSFSTLPRAPMATSGVKTTGTAQVAPMVPMFEMVNVPSAKCSGLSLPALASSCSIAISSAIWKMVLPCTPFTFGTTKPAGVAMATPMLWLPLMTTSIVSALTLELMMGYCRKASEQAFRTNGMKVNFGGAGPFFCSTSLQRCLTAIRASISTVSPQLNMGMVRACVMDLNIAFRTPVRASTVSPGLAAGGREAAGAVVGPGGGGGAPATPPCFRYFRTSSLRTLPSFPVPCRRLRGMLCSFAMCRTAGVAKTGA
mmetsp:Transcript_21614/g.38815  ORF Transcript_21614/g.38815 Transcript_21614/m.38815 type:complete len:269 (-) Transcript_21614:569-1375(-)